LIPFLTASVPLQPLLSFVGIAANKAFVYAVVLKITGSITAHYYHTLTQLLPRPCPHLPYLLILHHRLLTNKQLGVLEASHPVILMMRRSLIDSGRLGTRLFAAGGDVMTVMRIT